MGWPALNKPTHKLHYPARELDAFGRPKPWCNHSGSFQTPAQLTRDKSKLTCERCRQFVGAVSEERAPARLRGEGK